MGLITLGVGLSSSGELSFNTFGFLMALLSTCIFCCQNVYSKRLFRDKELSYMMLLFYTSLASFTIMLPWWALTEAHKITYSGSVGHLLTLYLFSGLCHWLQNVLAFAVLAAVSPLTYAIANTVKRIVVIVASILYFQNNISFLNGTGITLVIAYVSVLCVLCGMSEHVRSVWCASVSVIALNCVLTLTVASHCTISTSMTRPRRSGPRVQIAIWPGRRSKSCLCTAKRLQKTARSRIDGIRF